MRQCICIWFALLSIGLTGCFHSGHSTGSKAIPNVEVIYRGVDCQRHERKAAAVWINDREQLLQVYEQINTPVVESGKAVPPHVDFSRFGVLVILMGQKPTGGFHLHLGEKQVFIQNDIARLYIHWVEPPPDAVVPQMVTSPCLMLKLSKGGYSQLYILDQNGHLRTEVGVG